MDLEVAAIHSQTDKSSAVVTRSLGISTTAISRSDAGRASGGPEAPSGNPRMAVAARAGQYRALDCVRRAGSATAGRARAPLFARTPLIGARGPRFGGTVPL